MAEMYVREETVVDFRPKAVPVGSKDGNVTPFPLRIITHGQDFEVPKFRTLLSKQGASLTAAAATNDDWVRLSTMPGETGYKVLPGILQASLHEWGHGKLRLRIWSQIPEQHNPIVLCNVARVRAVQQVIGSIVREVWLLHAALAQPHGPL